MQQYLLKHMHICLEEVVVVGCSHHFLSHHITLMLLTFTFSFCCEMVSVIVVAVVISVIVRNLIGNSRASFLLDKVLSYITVSSAKLSNQILFSYSLWCATTSTCQFRWW